MMEWLGFLIFMMAINAIVAWWIPTLTRKELFFARTVVAGFGDSTEGKVILRQYRRRILAGTFGFLLCLLAGSLFELYWLMVMTAVGQGMVCWWAYLSARAAVLPHASPPTTQREVDLNAKMPPFPGGWLGWAPPFLLLTGLSFYLAYRWEDIPAKFPIHWDLQGHANGWATRSFWGVFSAPITGFSIMGVFLLIAFLIHRSRQIRARDSREIVFRNRTIYILIMANYYMSLLLVWVGLLPLSPPEWGGSKMAIYGLLGMTLLFGVLTFGILVKTGQGGGRLPGGPPAQTLPTGDGTPDACWKWGIFYCNPEDPAIFVEKRFGLGYTVNFGRPMAWIILGAIVVVPLVIAVLGSWMSR